jgi:hypothetical protein
MGGLFYLSIYHFARLTPLPYHVVVFMILLVNIYLAYRFATLLTGSHYTSVHSIPRKWP